MIAPQPTASGRGEASLRSVSPLYDGQTPILGLSVDPSLTPARRADVDLQLRERLALHVLAIGRMHTPEDLAGGVMPPGVLAAFADELEREEALSHVDLILDALSSRSWAWR